MDFDRKVRFFYSKRAILSDYWGPFRLNIMVYRLPDMNGKCPILQKGTPWKISHFLQIKTENNDNYYFWKISVQSQNYLDFWQITNENGAFMIIKMNKIAEKTMNFLHFEEKNVREFYFLFVLIFWKKGEFFQYLAVTVFILTPKKDRFCLFLILSCPTS